MIKIMAISLKRSQDRRDLFKNKMQEIGIDDFEFFDAIDGKNSDLSEYNIDRNRFQRFWHNSFVCCSSNVYFSNTDYGCSLSHLHVYQKIIDDNLDMALVCEDDSFIKKEYVDVIKNLENIVKDLDCDVLYLYCNDRLKSNFQEQDTSLGIKVKRIGMGKLDWFYNRRKNVNSTAAYVITKKGAQRLIEVGYPVRAQADVLLGLLAYNKLKSFRTVPYVCGVFDVGSTIVHAGEMSINRKPWYSRLARSIKSLYHRDAK